MFRSLSRGLVGGLLLLAVAPLWAVMVMPKALAGFSVAQSQALPVKTLRGYGSLGGQFTEYAAGQRRVSVLLMACPDTARAGVTLGKYLSDLRCLGGVADASVNVGGKTIPVVRVEGQGSIAALRAGAQVAVVAATQEADLSVALAAVQVEKEMGLDFTGSAVPMYLDKFDKYGWHFYFNPWSAPKGQADYDLKTNFDYLKEKQVGMLLPLSLNNIDSTEGVINYSGLGWAIEQGKQMNIPTVIQAWAIGAPRMLINRYPYDTMLKSPQFVGNFYGPGENGGGYPPEVAWSSEKAEDMLLSWLQPIYRRYAKYPNITGYAEPHGEIEHGTPMVFTDHGPVADAAYRKFLQEKYKTLPALNARWYGGQAVIKTWNDITVPEVANFLGWNSSAIDVGGLWKYAPENSLTPAERPKWASPELSDVEWKTMIAPGDDHPRFRNMNDMRAPGVFRRIFTLTPAQRDALMQKGNGKCYLYVWTLTRTGKKFEAALNGTAVGESTAVPNALSWGAFEVSGALQAGENLLALRLPWSELSYRVYLSPTPPRCYPDLGPQLNARWVDYRDFVVWTRYNQVRKGMETIRREDPDKFITLMSPNGMIDWNKVVAEDYGGTYHNTGYMSGWWNDYLPSLMRSSGLPFTLEAGNGAPDLPTLKRFVGHWVTEGVIGVHYFQNLGEVLWDPAQKAWFEEQQPLIHLFGKYHAPAAKVAVMYSGRTDRLSGFPWDSFPDQGFGLSPSFWSRYQLENQLPFPRDIILDNDFPRGNADKYQMIIDAGTVFMDASLVDRIGQWVRKGGIFVAYGQTGRHTPEVKDAWPFARLSGFRYLTTGRSGQISATPGQTIFTGDAWANPVHAGGMALEPVAADVQTLLKWQDGAPAVGLRKLGAGYIITMPTSTRGMLDDVLRWSGHFTPRLDAPNCFPREYVSNNGLYRVYQLWASGVKEPTTVTLTIPGPVAPTALRDIVSGDTLTGTSTKVGVSFSGIAVGKDDIHAYLAPRGRITSAPLDWLTLQRDWWAGTTPPRPAPAVPPVTNTLALDEDWAFSPVPDATDSATLTAPGVDDKGWTRISLGIWNPQGFPDVKRCVFRKTVTIPAGWNKGRVWAWLAGSGETLRPPYKTAFYIDGAKVWQGGGKYDVMSHDFTEKLTPGKHVLAWTMEGTTNYSGVIGDMWIEYVPNPVFTQSLAGDWGNGTTLPGKGTLTGAKYTFTPDARGKNYLVQFYIAGNRADVQSIYLNGKNIYFYGGPRGHHRRMTINPWLKWGEQNVLEIVPFYNDPMDVTAVELRFYRQDQL